MYMHEHISAPSALSQSVVIMMELFLLLTGPEQYYLTVFASHSLKKTYFTTILPKPCLINIPRPLVLLLNVICSFHSREMLAKGGVRQMQMTV